MMDEAIWREVLFDEIRTIADEEKLRRLWLAGNSHFMSSYAEEVAHVFDDFEVDRFISLGADHWNLGAELFAALCCFRDHFRKYVQVHPPRTVGFAQFEKVLADPSWREVAQAARDFVLLLDHWNGEGNAA